MIYCIKKEGVPILTHPLLLGVLAIEFVKIFCDGGHGVPCPYFWVSCVAILGMGGRCRA